MATDAQIQANRANATRSTGPRTASGKWRASWNACRHGLARPPLRSDVTTWYRLIMGAKAEQAYASSSDVVNAALELAEAEARLADAVRAEERFLEDMDSGANLAPHLHHAREIIEEIWHSMPGVSPEVERMRLARLRKAAYKITRKVKETWTQPHVHHERLARYRKAAEVRRHKALRTWVEAARKEGEENAERSHILPGVV